MISCQFAEPLLGNESYFSVHTSPIKRKFKKCFDRSFPAFLGHYSRPTNQPTNRRTRGSLEKLNQWNTNSILRALTKWTRNNIVIPFDLHFIHPTLSARFLIISNCKARHYQIINEKSFHSHRIKQVLHGAFSAYKGRIDKRTDGHGIGHHFPHSLTDWLT